MPVFLPNIPQPTDIQSISQGNFLDNFTVLGAIAGNNNVGSNSINDTAGFNYINLAPQGGTIPVVGTNNALWSGTSTITNQSEIYVKNTGVNTRRVPSTASVLSNTATPAILSNGWAVLPSGILLKWGLFQGIPGSTTTTQTFPATDAGGFAIPAFSFCFNVQLTPQLINSTTPPSIILNTVATNTVTFYLSGTATINVAYFAIGIYTGSL